MPQITLLSGSAARGFGQFGKIGSILRLQLWGWSNNATGQLGDNTTISTSSPVQVPGNNWVHVVARGNPSISLALKEDGTLWSWGANTGGQLGLNDSIPRSSPTQIPGTQWTCSITAGTRHAGAIKTDGTLWVWGSNSGGRLGTNNVISTSSPVQVPGNQWCALSFIGYYRSDHNYVASFALKTNNTLWAWGRDAYGTLGLNLPTYSCKSSPTQIPGTQWTFVAAGGSSVMATKSNGSLWMWGENRYGSLGDNSIIDRSSPVQIPGTWIQPSSGSGFADAVGARKTDGTLWMWGNNSYGTLGDITTIKRSSPVQIPGSQWSDFSVGCSFAFSTKTDGTLWGWGRNTAGRLGNNSTINRSSPVQIPGEGWYCVSGGFCNSMALKCSFGPP